ncbi:hypothetical protein [Streptomyces sp. NPDC056975]|uniref:hypothetical protein n=1 Tax=unclassified Streptomyces TaxID=2593676 RepID=UPI0036362660
MWITGCVESPDGSDLWKHLVTAALVHTVIWDPYDYPPTLDDAALTLAHGLPGKPLTQDKIRAGLLSKATELDARCVSP